MSTPNKQRPAPESQLRRLKELAAGARAEIFTWKDQVEETNASIRGRIAERFGIKLHRDSQLSEFWSWQFRQQAIDRLGEMMEQDEQLLTDKFPGLSRESIRDAAIKRGYAMADLAGDVKLSLSVAKVDLKDSEGERDSRKLALLEAKAKQADAAKGLLEDKALTESERSGRMRELFGMPAKV